MDLKQIIKDSLTLNASDIHLKAGMPPMIRVRGDLQLLYKESHKFSGKEIDELVNTLLTAEQIKTFYTQHDFDMSFGISSLGRFRMSLMKQRGTTRVVIRNIPYTTPTIESLNLPEVVKKISQFERGLILVTGITGAGKSSTLASMIDYINQHKKQHILTIEDPIEFLIRDKKSVITQREIGVDTINYTQALRAALRQDPDVILIGEIRDKESLEIALMAAETGHLVLSTLHTLDATETINRILMYFEPYQQKYIRHQLASVLKAVISQRLARKKDSSGFVPAAEIMINNARIKDMIINPDRTQEIQTAIHDGMATYQMQTFDQCLLNLLKKNIISLEEALRLSTSPEDLRIQYTNLNSHSAESRAKLIPMSPNISSDEYCEITLEDNSNDALDKIIENDNSFKNILKKKKR